MLFIIFNMEIPINLSLGFTILYSCIACLSISLCIYILGLGKKERNYISQFIKNKLHINTPI